MQHVAAAKNVLFMLLSHPSPQRFGAKTTYFTNYTIFITPGGDSRRKKDLNF
jgi:hypothetical protein